MLLEMRLLLVNSLLRIQIFLATCGNDYTRAFSGGLLQ